MFTGIIETLAKVISVHKQGDNLRFILESDISAALKIDQSVSHDGVCLTVIKTEENRHEVIAVSETLKRSSLGSKKAGDRINLERAMKLSDRIDGHLVQGHVDDVAICQKIKPKRGSWSFEFSSHKKQSHLLVDKGSVCINGVSLTVIKPGRKTFSVAIIPYTFENTNFHLLREGDPANIEFDIIGKYVMKWMKGKK
jgi:riboflavin synthase